MLMGIYLVYTLRIAFPIICFTVTAELHCQINCQPVEHQYQIQLSLLNGGGAGGKRAFDKLNWIWYWCSTKFDTWWLVLRRRTGPHSTRAACNNISRPCDYSDFITPPAPTARILALEHVGVKGTLRTENSMYIQFLTSTAHKAILCDWRCSIHAVNDNGTEEARMLRSKHPSSYLCTQPALVHC